MTNKSATLILGPHRSGTSAIAGCLSVCGLSFGDGLLPPSFDNKKGFFENPEIIKINDRLLAQQGLRWHDIPPPVISTLVKAAHGELGDEAVGVISNYFTNEKMFGIKDPRFCLTLPFWQEVMTGRLGISLQFVLVLRKPDETVHSLMRRNQFNLEKATNLTLHYMLQAMQYEVNPNDFHIIYFNRFLEDYNTYTSIFNSLALPLERDKLSEFLDTSLLQSVYRLDSQHPSLLKLRAMYKLLDGIQFSEKEKPKIKNLSAVFYQNMGSNTRLNFLPKKYPYSYLFKHMLKEFLHSPKNVLRHLNKKNVRTLLRAVREENPHTILKNFRKLIKQ